MVKVTDKNKEIRMNQAVLFRGYINVAGRSESVSGTWSRAWSWSWAWAGSGTLSMSRTWSKSWIGARLWSRSGTGD
jgi:hypothetical protein